MPNLRGSEWLIIILLVVLLFGAKRLPDAARSIGRSLRIFKAETKGLAEDASAGASTAPAAEAVPGSSHSALPGVSPGTIAGSEHAPALAPQRDAGSGSPQAQPPGQA